MINGILMNFLLFQVEESSEQDHNKCTFKAKSMNTDKLLTVRMFDFFITITVLYKDYLESLNVMKFVQILAFEKQVTKHKCLKSDVSLRYEQDNPSGVI